MSKQPEHDVEKTASGSEGSPDSKTTEGSNSPSKAASVFLKLKLVATHAMKSFPLLPVLALVIAAMAFADNLSIQAQLSMASAKEEKLNASLLASKAELEELKLSMSQNKSVQESEHRKHDELSAEIIRNVTNLQIKLKIYPTLEEQLVQQSGAAGTASDATSTSASGHRQITQTNK